MQNLDVYGVGGVFFLRSPLRVLRQRIGSSVCLALAVVDLEVILRKFLSSADLSGAQTFCIHKTTKVVVVCKDEDLMFATF